MAGLRRTAALLLLVATACGEADAQPTELAIADLARFAERYDGELVATRGVVQRFDEPEHYWIEGPGGKRVAIHPATGVRDRVGEHVRVVGVFTYDRERGRRLVPRTIEPRD